MNQFQKNKSLPRFPLLLGVPFKLMPVKLHSQLLVTFLNRILSQQLKDGELDFLERRRLTIKVSDTSIRYSVVLVDGRLVPEQAAKQCDLVIQASVYDFLMIAARKEDPDTLVFQRRLIMQGDTELGLELKNFLDGLDIESTGAFSVIESILQRGLPVYRRLFS